MKKIPLLKLILLTVFFLPAIISNSQNIAINKSSNTGNPAAALDLSDASNNSLGVLLPNVALTDVNSATPVSSPVAGLVVWNTNTPATTGGFGAGFYYWSGSQWLYMSNSMTTSVVSGSGTSAFVSRWTSSSVLGTGVLQDNGTGVGLSASALTPLSSLDVNGGAAIGSYAGSQAAPSNGLIVSGRVGVGTNTPDASAALDVTSASSGALIPRLTYAQITAMSYPVTVGLVVYDLTSKCFIFNTTGTATGWDKIACAP